MSLMNDNVNRRGLDTFDWCFLGVIMAIISLGILSIYSVTNPQSGTGFPIYLKQATWMMVGSLAFLVAVGIDYHKLARLSYVLYGIGLILLIIVLIAGKTSRGSQRWIPLGPFAVQPSEFIKIPLLLMLAAYYGATTREGWVRRLIIPGLIVLPGFLLILKQPDLGSSLGFLAIFLVVILTVGMKSKAFGFVILAALMLFPFAWGGVWGSLHEYQQDRILSFVDPNSDPGGKGYHGLQSRIAIGSGQLLGKGLYGGTQTQFKFLPEGHTDFVFAVFAEEWGFIGSIVLLSLYILLFLMGLEIALKAKDIVGTLLAVGVVTMIAFGVVVNIAMTSGLAPVVGIPLPLMSYGGSAMVVNLTALGLLLNVKRRRLSLL
ncbi:rod shape-determining protein RodA [Candidatus Nitrospira allomarina]|jgi:rod shape determining protein RodA|uniref:Peptidoglycan glycosyltransferase RodA n=1 Tax=Candidatus Nitrospira allomarina TaxID=3020900 RepID=A0AA96GK71_9BACT|nr:rod shape-determining protein RodA [Candidatus Nitrospira allomarina]WNM59111.1 rod shape-determining protein RodA [Candidatus Nitrospira allomarina]